MAGNRQRGKGEGGVLTSVQGLQITKVLDEKKKIQIPFYSILKDLSSAPCAL